MSLIVADNNTGAKALYERCGYREATRRRMVKDGWDSPGSDWILMVKP
jgi:ribosomal protein S18 acetylase RimI-like enzyme